MIARFLGLVTLSLLLAAPARAADPLSFDDPGMHFNAPAGWTRVDTGAGPGGAGEAQQDAPAAAFVYHQGQPDQRLIVVTITPYDGTLEDFEGHHESELHSGQDATYVEKRLKTKLANGMPAYYLRISSGAEAGHFVRRYEYLVYDGTRTIVVSLVARQGEVDDQEAQAALSTLYVVAYPKPHP